MQDTEQLIKTLAGAPKNTHIASDPFLLCFNWLVAVIAYIVVMSLFLELRVDLMERLATPLFLAEIASLALFVISTSLAAFVLSFPDLYQKPKLLWLPYFSGALFVVVMTLAWLADDPLAPHPIHDLECLTCITLLSFVPAAVLFQYLRTMAPIQRGRAGAMAMLSAFGIGALTLRLCEQTDSIAHLLQWHYLPMLGFNIAGILLGKKFLRW
jgi:hypothetical protein